MQPATTPAVGIDLGTTLSVVAHLDALGRPCTILNSEGDPTTPSAVLFDKASVVVGKEALKAAALEPQRIAQFAKRDMGAEHYGRPVNGEYLPPEVIQSLILETVRHAVITVPAYFNEPRRKATQDAGRLAGLEVLDIINEPTAAAILFGYQEGFLARGGHDRGPEIILVYDLGGGTFDVTLMQIDGQHYITRATAGDVCLGGLDWDRRLADYIAEQFQARHRGADPRQHPAALERLMREAEEVKHALTARREVTATFEHAGEGVRLNVTREQFESMTADLLQRTLFTVRQLLRETGVGWKDITRLLLVGGSTRMPMVQRALEEESGRPVDRSVSADEAVAHGAALYAGLLLADPQHAPSDVRITNVNSHSLGVLAQEQRTGRPRNAVIIARNTALPVTQCKMFRTLKPNQRDVAVTVIEGGDASGRDSTPIGTCVVDRLPPNLPAGTPVEVFFSYGRDGRLTVHSRLPGAGREATLTIDRKSGLSDAKLRHWQHRLRGGDESLCIGPAGAVPP
jgi:molecular chaperone DnaK